jgi:hypothetical protein
LKIDERFSTKDAVNYSAVKVHVRQELDSHFL